MMFLEEVLGIIVDLGFCYLNISAWELLYLQGSEG